jgi:hypothetical protein
MPPKAYPNLPESPQPKSKNTAVVVDQVEDLPKYNITRAATGTGIISSVLTLSTVRRNVLETRILIPFVVDSVK